MTWKYCEELAPLSLSVSDPPPASVISDPRMVFWFSERVTGEAPELVMIPDPAEAVMLLRESLNPCISRVELLPLMVSTPNLVAGE